MHGHIRNSVTHNELGHLLIVHGSHSLKASVSLCRDSEKDFEEGVNHVCATSLGTRTGQEALLAGDLKSETFRMTFFVDLEQALFQTLRNTAEHMN